VKVAPRCNRLLKSAGVGVSTPTAVPVAPCGWASYTPVYPFTTINASALPIASETVPAASS